VRLVLDEHEAEALAQLPPEDPRDRRVVRVELPANASGR
jgi:hypothetical protein